LVGHDDGEHAGAGVRYANTRPSRVIATTDLRAVLAVSSVPNEPISGLATIQPEVSFGHALTGCPPPL
jgi:hypothetical protein